MGGMRDRVKTAQEDRVQGISTSGNRYLVAVNASYLQWAYVGKGTEIELFNVATNILSLSELSPQSVTRDAVSVCLFVCLFVCLIDWLIDVTWHAVLYRQIRQTISFALPPFRPSKTIFPVSYYLDLDLDSSRIRDALDADVIAACSQMLLLLLFSRCLSSWVPSPQVVCNCNLLPVLLRSSRRLRSSGSDRLHLPIIRRSTVGSRTFTELFRRRGMERPAGSRHSCAVTRGLQTAP